MWRREYDITRATNRRDFEQVHFALCWDREVAGTAVGDASVVFPSESIAKSVVCTMIDIDWLVAVLTVLEKAGI